MNFRKSRNDELNGLSETHLMTRIRFNAEHMDSEWAQFCDERSELYNTLLGAADQDRNIVEAVQTRFEEIAEMLYRLTVRDRQQAHYAMELNTTLEDLSTAYGKSVEKIAAISRRLEALEAERKENVIPLNPNDDRSN